MGQFKPMVKMETTEPSIELKLKKGGSVSQAFKDAKKAASSEHGHKSMPCKADGGEMNFARMMGKDAMISPMAKNKAAKVGKPSLAERRAAMSKVMGKKEGGETKAVHKSEMARIGKVEKELKSHEAKPASKAHKGMKDGGNCYKTGGVVKGNGGGYKTGGVVKGNGGGYATGGVVNGQGGFKDGGSTGDVKLGNAGGYKKGGALKKFASGGSVNDSGKAEQMPQGKKKPSAPVAINMLSGSFKKGGNVSSKKLQAMFKKENAPAMKAAKADSNEKYSPYQKKAGGKVKKMADGGSYYEDFQDPENMMAEKRRMRNLAKGEKAMADMARAEEMENEKGFDIVNKIKGAYNKVKGALKGEGSVTDTERTISRTVTPPTKKRGGKV
jgi:hypothetical protein